MAHRVHLRNLDHDGLVDELKGINRYYQNDGQFKYSLHREGFYNSLSSRDIKYLLTEYEIHLRKKGDLPLALETQEKILTSDYEVEHIWAQHPEAEMSEDQKLEHQQNVHRLGNLTIASKSWNSSMGNKPFEEKRCQPGNCPSYANSSLLVQKELAEQPTWNVARIRCRETRILEFALRRWSV